MRKSVVASTGLVALCAAAVGTAVAQDGATNSSGTALTVDATVSPNKAGTNKKPQPVKLKVKVHWETAVEVEKPVTQSATVFFPPGSLYNGAKHPKCSQNVLARKGPAGCPKGSVMGKGSGVAYADDVYTKPQITVVNGGKSAVYLYTVMTNPARVKAPVPGKITKLSSGPWAYKLELTVPRTLQNVAGVPIALRDVSVTAGKGDWLATTSCPADKQWRYEVETFFAAPVTGSAKYADSVPCR
jgi:hypothetical protein